MTIGCYTYIKSVKRANMNNREYNSRNINNRLINKAPNSIDLFLWTYKLLFLILFIKSLEIFIKLKISSFHDN